MTKDHTVSQDDSGSGKEGLSPSVAQNDARDAKSSGGGSAHTPGPWKCSGCGIEVPDLINRCDCVTICAFRVGANGRLENGVKFASAAQAHHPHLTMLEAELLEALIEARDLLLERTQGSHARSAGHNARLVMDAAIAKATSDPTPLSAELGATGNDQGREEPK